MASSERACWAAVESSALSALYQAIERDRLPDSASADPPVWWKPGMPLSISDAERITLMVPRAQEEARASDKRPREEPARPNESEPTRTYRWVERSVKDWLLDWAELQ